MSDLDLLFGLSGFRLALCRERFSLDHRYMISNKVKTSAGRVTISENRLAPQT